MRVGLTGGIGSGKSAVAEIFSELGALTIDTDLLAREAVTRGSDGIREIAMQWPQAVREGVLDRAALAEIVFADPSARERLNAIVHPHVRRLALERERFAAPGQLIVHVVPLLFETDYIELVDKSVVVIADDAQRIARVVARDLVKEEQVRARMATQISPEKAALRADYVIKNDDGVEHLRSAVQRVYQELVRLSVP
ncbi:MAG: dephospho-CoA kinase [Vulcanimicrobiaceae bacterium]